MEPRTVQNRCGKSHPYRDSIPGPPNLWPVAIPTTLAGPHFEVYLSLNLTLFVKLVLGVIIWFNFFFFNFTKVFELQTEVYFLICRVLAYVPHLPSKEVTRFHVSFKRIAIQGHSICWSLINSATQLQSEVPEKLVILNWNLHLL